jgi:hypothetical protein
LGPVLGDTEVVPEGIDALRNRIAWLETLSLGIPLPCGYATDNDSEHDKAVDQDIQVSLMPHRSRQLH